ncbi:FAD binding domain-containing protein [Aspergillus pseudoustus]|uniref:FAD binding domain-containing protein n=1 Tax=Aspergillus pseudoustus TaxID=1810923 RepID=A0ABR4JR07_9EURO
MDTPVLIVGAGPSGATTALLLAQKGIKSLVISKHRGTANTPRAHIFNQRAMEVLRSAGLEEELKAIACPATDMQHTSWVNQLAGEEYGRIYAWGNKPAQKGDYEAASPCAMSDLPQSLLEPVLVRRASELGAEFRFATELVSFTQDAGPGGLVRATLRARSSSSSSSSSSTAKEGKEEENEKKEVGDTIYVVTARYLIGADGARSQIIAQLGIPVVGRQHNSAFNVHIKADLSRYIAPRPGSLNWVLNVDAPDWSVAGNFRMVRPWDEFVVSMHPATSGDTEDKSSGAAGTDSFSPSEEMIRKRLYQMIGDTSIPIEILSTFTWTINEQVAERWQDGRTLCIGDATHRHPPINGLGSNTCISDAFNIAWKLAYVLKGWAAPTLLDTLTPERKPVGDGVVRRANDGMAAHRRIWGLLGKDPESRKAALEALRANTEEGARKRHELRDAFLATEDEVQALGIQMNQVYDPRRAAVVVEPRDIVPTFGGLNPIREVMSSTYPGYHLPHVWLAGCQGGLKVSTLDLCGGDGFTLFTGIGGESWVRAARDFSARIGGPRVRAYVVGFGCEYQDCYWDWERVRGVRDDGAVLVRPDHFVAWRCDGLVADPLGKLSQVMGKLLGKEVAKLSPSHL